MLGHELDRRLHAEAGDRVWIGLDQPRTIIRNGYAGEIAVPLWAGFMKVATKDDKPEWLTRPAGVIGTNVCRISGKLPAGGCDQSTSSIATASSKNGR